MNNFQRIQHSYEKQCENIMNYVEMIDNIRKVVYKNIQRLNDNVTSEATLSPTLVATSVPNSVASLEARRCSQPISNDERSSNIGRLDKIHVTTKKTIHHAEESASKLDGVIKQLRRTIQKK